MPDQHEEQSLRSVGTSLIDLPSSYEASEMDTSHDMLNLRSSVEAYSNFFHTVLTGEDSSRVAENWTEEIRDELLPALDTYMDHITYVTAEDLTLGLDMMAESIFTQFWKDKSSGSNPHFIFLIPDVNSNLYISAHIIERLSKQGLTPNQLTAGVPSPNKGFFDRVRTNDETLQAIYCDDFLISGNQLATNFELKGIGKNSIPLFGIPRVLCIASARNSVGVNGLGVPVDSMLPVKSPSPQLGYILTGNHSPSDYGVTVFFDKLQSRVKSITRVLKREDRGNFERMITQQALPQELCEYFRDTTEFVGLRLPDIVLKEKPYRVGQTGKFNDPAVGSLYRKVLQYFDEESRNTVQNLVVQHEEL